MSFFAIFFVVDMLRVLKRQQRAEEFLAPNQPMKTKCLPQGLSYIQSFSAAVLNSKFTVSIVSIVVAQLIFIRFRDENVYYSNIVQTK